MEHVILLQSYHGISPWFRYMVGCTGVLQREETTPQSNGNGQHNYSGWINQWYVVKPSDSIVIDLVIWEEVQYSLIRFELTEEFLDRLPAYLLQPGALGLLHEYLLEEGLPTNKIDCSLVKGPGVLPPIQPIEKAS